MTKDDKPQQITSMRRRLAAAAKGRHQRPAAGRRTAVSRRLRNDPSVQTVFDFVAEVQK